jgi:hypothetical protein
MLLITHFHLVVEVKTADSRASMSRPKFISDAVPVFFTFIGDVLMPVITLLSYNSCQLDRRDLAFV